MKDLHDVDASKPYLSIFVHFRGRHVFAISVSLESLCMSISYYFFVSLWRALSSPLIVFIYFEFYSSLVAGPPDWICFIDHLTKERTNFDCRKWGGQWMCHMKMDEARHITIEWYMSLNAGRLSGLRNLVKRLRTVCQGTYFGVLVQQIRQPVFAAASWQGSWGFRTAKVGVSSSSFKWKQGGEFRVASKGAKEKQVQYVTIPPFFAVLSWYNSPLSRFGQTDHRILTTTDG